jgi:hypothetical protein
MMRRRVIVRLTPKHAANSDETRPLATGLVFVVDMRKLVLLNQFAFCVITGAGGFQWPAKSQSNSRVHVSVMVSTALLLWPTLAFAQSPWERAASNLERTFTGPLARSLALVAIVIGGLMRLLLLGAESVPRRINQGRELSSRENAATLNHSVNSRTLRIKQLLGLAYSMANLDLAAPGTAILHKRRFSCPFAGLQAQLQPVAKIVQYGEPRPQQLSANASLFNFEWQSIRWKPERTSGTSRGAPPSCCRVIHNSLATTSTRHAL